MGAGSSSTLNLAVAHAVERSRTATDAVPEPSDVGGEGEALETSCAPEQAPEDGTIPSVTEPGDGGARPLFSHTQGSAKSLPSTYQKSRWEKLYGNLFESVLKGNAEAPIRLVDAHWLVVLERSGGRIGHRQSLPPEAFVSLDDLKMFGCPESLLPVICVSYPWLHPAHPDPKSAHLHNLAVGLRALVGDCAAADATLTGPSGTQRYGVFIDFCSLLQHPDPANGKFRSADEDVRFKRGLSMLGGLYAAVGTTVMRLTELPPEYPLHYDLPDDCNVSQYVDRGWCFTESCWAALTKPSRASFDLGRRAGAAPASREELLDACAGGGGRRPPLLPAEFAAALQHKTFTNGKEDRPLVQSLYEVAFHNTFRHVFVLKYDQLGWANSDAESVARVLAAVATPASSALKGKHSLRAAQLNELYLMENSIGDRGAIAVMNAAATLRGLSWIDLTDNKGVGDATLERLAELLEAKRSNFKRLKRLRLVGTGAGERAKKALAGVCEQRKIQLKLAHDDEA